MCTNKTWENFSGAFRSFPCVDPSHSYKLYTNLSQGRSRDPSLNFLGLFGFCMISFNRISDNDFSGSMFLSYLCVNFCIKSKVLHLMCVCA